MKTISFFLIVLSFIYADSTVESSEDKNSTVKVDNVEVKELLLSIKEVKKELSNNDLFLKKFGELPVKRQQDTLKILFKDEQIFQSTPLKEVKKMKRTIINLPNRDIDLNPIDYIIPIDNNDSNQTDEEKKKEQKEKFEIFRKSK
jgi:hypothetical protein